MFLFFFFYKYLAVKTNRVRVGITGKNEGLELSRRSVSGTSQGYFKVTCIISKIVRRCFSFGSTIVTTTNSNGFKVVRFFEENTYLSKRCILFAMYHFYATILHCSKRVIRSSRPVYCIGDIERTVISVISCIQNFCHDNESGSDSFPENGAQVFRPFLRLTILGEPNSLRTSRAGL